MSRKAIHLISDIDLLCALEKEMPSVRAIHLSLGPAFRALSTWDRDQVVRMDKELKRNIRVTKGRIKRSLNHFALSRLQAARLDDCEFSNEIDLYTLLELGWGMNMLRKTLDDVENAYTLPFQVICSRISGKHGVCQELHALHAAYGGFSQSRNRLGNLLKSKADNIRMLGDGLPTMQESHDLATEAYAACTDARDAFLVLKDAHQAAYERSKARF